MIYVDVYITLGEMQKDYAFPSRVTISHANEKDFVSEMISYNILPTPKRAILYREGSYLRGEWFPQRLTIEGTREDGGEHVHITLPIGSCVITKYIRDEKG